MEKVSNDDIKWLLELLAREHLAEIQVSVGDTEVVVQAVATSGPAAAAWPGEGSACCHAAPAEPDNLERLLAPMAGIFYRTPSPESAPYVDVGDELQVGDTIGLIEAMKLYNEVTSHLHGRIAKFLTENEQHVQADQPLVLIERLSH